MQGLKRRHGLVKKCAEVDITGTKAALNKTNPFTPATDYFESSDHDSLYSDGLYALVRVRTPDIAKYLAEDSEPITKRPTAFEWAHQKQKLETKNSNEIAHWFRLRNYQGS